MHGSLELHSGDPFPFEREEGMREGEGKGEKEGKREGEGERDTRIRRNMSLPLAMVRLLDHDSDDVIAVPVRSSAATTR